MDMPVKITTIPDELEMLVAFDVEPVTAMPRDGLWVYEIDGEDGFRLRISFDTYVAACEVILFYNAQTITKASYLGVDSVETEKNRANEYLLKLKADYKTGFLTTIIKVKPHLSIEEVILDHSQT
jgi:hypothetical protein